MKNRHKTTRTDKIGTQVNKLYLSDSTKTFKTLFQP